MRRKGGLLPDERRGAGQVKQEIAGSPGCPPISPEAAGWSRSYTDWLLDMCK